MIFWQQAFLLLFLLYSLLAFIHGFWETKIKKNPFGLSLLFNPLGSFVWGDAVIFGIFWFGASVITLLLNNWLLFWLTFSVFWTIRSFGETIYWLLEQFSQKTLNKPETLWTSKIFPHTSAWFAMQIFWQCATVVFLILTFYLGKLWFFS